MYNDIATLVLALVSRNIPVSSHKGNFSTLLYLLWKISKSEIDTYFHTATGESLQGKIGLLHDMLLSEPQFTRSLWSHDPNLVKICVAVSWPIMIWVRLSIKTVMYGIFIIKIRLSDDRLIFIMGIPILLRRRLCIEKPLGPNFALATTAQMWWHVQYWDRIGELDSKLR